MRAVEYDRRSNKDFSIYKVEQDDSNHVAASSAFIPTVNGLGWQSSLAEYGAQPSQTQQHPLTEPPRIHRVRREVNKPSLEAQILRRKYIYNNQLYSLHFGTSWLSRSHDLTPEQFSNDLTLVHRARKWIRRELKVFDFLDKASSPAVGERHQVKNVEFLLEYILALLKTVDIKGSGGQAEDMLQEFFGRDNTRIFLHELRAFLRSPHSSLEAWDRDVQYDELPRRRHKRKIAQDPEGEAQAF